MITPTARWLAGLLAALALLITGCAVGVVAPPVTERDAESGLELVDLDQLPAEARRTADLIRAGGPFPYRKDGAAFGNREGLLPDRPSGYYREFTVPTPGEDDRGARRIVTGDDDRILYYTDDHYQSFRRIRS
ncbi:ribonuclease domain-containing protein [Microlunatus speluncae]|uniref:ribonuclease domain-containing protein n=1 Tax=Microlunatus speluncae TaxID=2594267 RepID=UPI001266165E|nr:ribonuclease domain-containing protein [Microlunatus speluncae]